MPIYTYKCKTCGIEMDEYRKLEDRLGNTKCESCGCAAEFTIAPLPKPTDHLYPYVDDNISAKPIEIRSRKHYLQELKQRGLQERTGGKTARWV